MTVDVLIVTFRRPRLLQRSLQTLIAASKNAGADFQTRFVVAVNGDDAESLQIAQTTLAGSVASISVVKECTPAEARNRALTLVTAEWVYFADDDVFVDDGFIARFKQIAELHPEHDVIGGPNLTPPNSSDFQVASGFSLASRLACYKCATRYRQVNEIDDCSEASLILCNLFARKAVVPLNPFPPELVCAEENYALIRWQEKGARALYHPALSVFHERRANLKAFTKQIFKYGRGRGHLVAVGDFKWFHLVPSIALIGFITALFVAHDAALTVFFSYLSVITFEARGFTEGKAKQTLWMILLIPVLHASYACGVLFGALLDRLRNPITAD